MLFVETAAPVTGDYPDEPRLPLLTAAEARELFGLLLHFDDDSEQGRRAGQMARDLAMRVPPAQ
ncbi:hypothetical protein [Streptomyces sp. NPDC055607]